MKLFVIPESFPWERKGRPQLFRGCRESDGCGFPPKTCGNDRISFMFYSYFFLLLVPNKP
ncbi:MAG: hypothetical protein A3G33_05655 [Omnitrophica bacterium RIFCSPLOWO2_12_FULL_44_17]|uniref:Uncharacterized protein n=1 Tax=Candidatus Danuiimicrobium aquiferis TaxID=1801832 RepID=A0A1G1L352_9BACT|nr:MAG: hypothetical protein A3B72_05135 [Omnitrophica bacterium RIFCSPHIGHO2_02_FULL_45_28]OGW92279.1 MAG: hypothetical protein A3E74_09340 [Omnitrophica bacterium RIFCSPHIGHO2_12_FULL_44_12]OGW99558.1 MAG: hypothetical protein A3G33_05655 [Omnitrophica bacterium RIFCSPLOWO2_12_FULL_44_17]OGX04007.1 MAG: hypothetical protein A3J12_06195 [Omnitrophica bacterium RIFCSPLOWO2_02_FULL_44_11]